MRKSLFNNIPPSRFLYESSFKGNLLKSKSNSLVRNGWSELK